MLGSPGASQPLNTRLCLSSTLAFSLCLMPLTLAVGAITPFSGPSAPPPPFLTATQRVHPPHLPSSPGPPLCTSNMTTLLTTNLTNKTKENKRPKNPFPCSPLSQELVTWPRAARAVFTHTCPMDMFPGLAMCVCLLLQYLLQSCSCKCPCSPPCSATNVCFQQPVQSSLAPWGGRAGPRGISRSTNLNGTLEDCGDTSSFVVKSEFLLWNGPNENRHFHVRTPCAEAFWLVSGESRMST